MGLCLSMNKNSKAPGIEEFPGDFKKLPELQYQVQMSFNTRFQEWLSTGYYLSAGVTMALEVASETPGNLSKWKVRIGAHYDDLCCSYSDCETFRRWPCITMTKGLEPHLKISSPYGGLVFIESPPEGGSIKVQLSNVVEAPFFDLTKPETIKDWPRRINSPGK